MELPKHTTQVGTIAANKKLYLEDYCISYMKQLGEMYPDDRKQIALFGIVEKEKSVEYAFAYGAALLGRGKGRTDSLTNSQKEEAESFREEYFPDYQLLGIVIATDAVDENVYWLGNGNKAIPLDGYYIFYDKNEAMLNFMMHNQKEEREIDLDPVIIKKADMDREKREKKEREEQERLETQKQREAQKKSGKYRQSIQKSEKTMRPEKQRKKSAFPVAACLLVLAIAGIYGVKTYYPEMDGLGQLKSYVSGIWDKAAVLTNGYLGDEESAASTEQNFVNQESEVLLDATEANGSDITVVTTEIQQPAELDVIVIPEPDSVSDNAGANGVEENNTETGQPIVNQVPDSQTTNQEAANQGSQQQSATNQVQQSGSQENGQVIAGPGTNTQQGNSVTVTQQPAAGTETTQQPDNSQSTETVSQQYLIKKGDSLLRILRAYYGDDSRLSEICDVNGITDPNNIQVGQTILLP